MKTDYFYQMIPVEYEATDDFIQDILQKFPVPTLPSSEEGFDLEQAEKGHTVKTRVLLSDFETKRTKTDKQFLKMTFSNQNGTISAKMWDNQGAVEKNVPLLEEHGIFDIEAFVDEFNGFKSLTVNRLTPCYDDINPFSLLAYTKQDIREFTIELFSYIDELSSPYREIAYKSMEKFWTQFSIRPAAKGFHHNYLGGLLKHTVGLMRFARYLLKFEVDPYQGMMKLILVVEKQYKQELWESFKKEEERPRLVWKDTIDHFYRMLQGMMLHKEDVPNYDRLITSILFHDIGKLMEYDHAGKTQDSFSYLYPTADFNEVSTKQAGIAMDPLGVMIGHIPYGVLLLTKIIDDYKIEVSALDIHHMSHNILCHHGLPEWGAAVRQPQSMEGYLIHLVDFLDSRYENTEEVK
ncbi:hydrolase [Saliterribacillus persicus]|uniref:3'-5' exoribonuclease n=1 Tax=Saliterribacillus persicus TaxID=930114 RepID=A0A368XRJ5_9BACI|nr:hydrolase [Saliterribacillus persicus]RCW69658.1 3'-5' exoribonuclease [Saliterribacillus persicus]